MDPVSLAIMALTQMIKPSDPLNPQTTGAAPLAQPINTAASTSASQNAVPIPQQQPTIAPAAPQQPASAPAAPQQLTVAPAASQQQTSESGASQQQTSEPSTPEASAFDKALGKMEQGAKIGAAISSMLTPKPMAPPQLPRPSGGPVVNTALQQFLAMLQQGGQGGGFY